MIDKNIEIEKAKKIKLILMDVDGVLTKGEIIFDALGNEIKVWDVKDGLSFSIVKRLPDIDVGWITGRKSESVKKRAEDLDIKYLFMGELDKISAYKEIKKLSNLKDEEIAYIGDDLIDLPVLRAVGLSICPFDAVEEVINICDLKTDCIGGKGVFRSVLKFVLSAQNRWDNIEKIFEKK
jgi:3-deoxy-D-manno-octulosonate 8-phosphate phosphatase (KDO 8-P phosphatase)